MANHTPTEGGCYVQDRCGIWHYRRHALGHVSNAFEDALKHKPDGACFFWFNGTYAPILKGDDVNALNDRWWSWRQAHQETPALLTVRLDRMAEGAMPVRAEEQSDG